MIGLSKSRAIRFTNRDRLTYSSEPREDGWLSPDSQAKERWHSLFAKPGISGFHASSFREIPNMTSWLTWRGHRDRPVNMRALVRSEQQPALIPPFNALLAAPSGGKERTAPHEQARLEKIDRVCRRSGLALLQRHAQPVPFHVEDGLEPRVGRNRLDVIRCHIHVMRQNEPTRPHQRQHFAQVIDVALLIGIDEAISIGPFSLGTLS